MAKLSQDEINVAIEAALSGFPSGDPFARDVAKAMVLACAELDETELEGLSPSTRFFLGVLAGGYTSLLNKQLYCGEVIDLKELRHHLTLLLDEMEEITVLHTPAILDGHTLYRPQGPKEVC